MRTWVAVVVVAVGMASAGCSGAGSPLAGGSEEQPPSPRGPGALVQVVEGRAKLDRGAATFQLPLDSYGMSGREQQLTAAAAQVVFGRCVAGSADVGEATRRAARDSLSAPPPVSNWVFGYWNAEYLAANGLSEATSGPPIGEGLEVDPVKAKECVASDDYLAIEQIAPSYHSQGVEARALVEANLESWSKTVADPRFRELADKRDRCVADQGYAIEDNSKLGGIKPEESWSAEERLKAALAEAKCADQLDLAQRAADIQAAYQQLAIDQNQAEFVQIRRLADERVARATALLGEVGVV